MLLLPLLALALLGCDAGPSDTTPPSASALPIASPMSIGDGCLIGTWVLLSQQSTSTAGSLSGYTGARMTITAQGAETTDYSSAGPYRGTLNGQSVSITRHGAWSFQDYAAKGKLVRTAVSSHLVETYSYSTSTTSQAIHAAPTSTYAYRCNATQLQYAAPLTDPSGSFLTSWSKLA